MCSLHLNSRDAGCTSYMAKNLRLEEILSYFFKRVDNVGSRMGSASKALSPAFR